MSADDRAPPADHPSRGPNPGVRVRRRPRQGAQITVDGDRSLLELHRALLDAGLRERVHDVLRGLDGEGSGDFRDVLREVHGVEALDDLLADVLADAAQALRDRDLDRTDDVGALERADDALRQLGSGTVLGTPSTLDDLDWLPSLLASSATTPTVTVRLGVSWASRRPEQRADVLGWLVRLGLGARVDLVVSEAAARVMVDDHRAALPAGVLTSLRNRGRGSPGPLAGETEAATEARTDAVETALAALDDDGRPAGLLRALGREPGHAATYDRLEAVTATDRSDLYEPVRVLAEHGLAETVDSAEGNRTVSLLPAGLDAVRRLSAESGPSGRSASAAGAHAEGQTGAASDHPKISPAMPCGPGQAREAPSPPAADADRPDGPDDWHSGTIWPRLASRRRSAPVMALGDVGDVALVDAADDDDLTDHLERPLRDLDPRQPVVSFDSAEDTAMLGYGRYQNPMQSWVALALGATSEELWGEGDLEARIGDRLDGLEISERGLLWNAVEAGWLPVRDDSGQPVNDGEAVHDQLRSARDDLRDLLRERDLHSRDSDLDAAEIKGNRREVAAFAAGLATTVIDLLDLAGVDVLLEVRIDDCSRHFGAGNPDRRDDLLEHIQRLSLLNSRAGAWSVWRQLFESRENVRSDGWTPGAGAPRTGSLNCGLVIAGGSVETLEADLADALQERTGHPEAPELGVDVNLRTGADSARLASTARRMLLAKGLRPTPSALAVMAGWSADPWTVADALHWGLRSEAARDVHLDELRTALATVDAHRLIGDGINSAPRDGVAALLRADEPLSQAELCRRADISPPTWRGARDDLTALGVVRETAGGWRVALPRRDERHDPPELAKPPWWLLEAGGDGPGDVGAEGRRAADVVEWLAWDRHDLAPDDLPDHVDAVLEAAVTGEPPDRSTVDAALEQLGAPPSLVRAGCHGDRAPSTATVRVGQPKQTRLSDHPKISPIG